MLWSWRDVAKDPEIGRTGETGGNAGPGKGATCLGRGRRPPEWSSTRRARERAREREPKVMFGWSQRPKVIPSQPDCRRHGSGPCGVIKTNMGPEGNGMPYPGIPQLTDATTAWTQRDGAFCHALSTHRKAFGPRGGKYPLGTCADVLENGPPSPIRVMGITHVRGSRGKRVQPEQAQLAFSGVMQAPRGPWPRHRTPEARGQKPEIQGASDRHRTTPHSLDTIRKIATEK